MRPLHGTPCVHNVHARGTMPKLQQLGVITMNTKLSIDGLILAFTNHANEITRPTKARKPYWRNTVNMAVVSDENGGHTMTLKIGRALPRYSQRYDDDEIHHFKGKPKTARKY